MYVEADFLTALMKDEDWLQGAAIRVLDEHEDIHTSILAYAEILVLMYDREAAEYDIDAPRAITNLLELVPIAPAEHEEAVLAAAAFLDEYDLTPFDALHLVESNDETIVSSDSAYEEFDRRLDLREVDDR